MKDRANKNRRVVITGLGVVSSLGIGWQKFWKNLIAGNSGISKVETFDTSKYDRHYAGEVKDFDASKFIDKRFANKIGRSSQMAIAASLLALKDAGLNEKKLKKKTTAASVGTTMGESQVIEGIVKEYVKKNIVSAKRMAALMYPSDSILSNMCNYLKVSNEGLLFANACAASNYSIGYAYDLIKNGTYEKVLAGGVDSLSRIAFTGFGRLFAMAPKKCQPFDSDRKGMMLGEGAAIVLLESLESAEKRGANIYAEVSAYGLSCDAHHMTNPTIKGISNAMEKAIVNAGISKEDVDYISTHGTGTKEY